MSFVPIATVPGLGRIEADCNAENNQDIRYVSTAGSDVHVMVDTGAANATLADDVSAGANSTTLNVTSLTTAAPEFQIWRLTRGASQTATVFVEMQPIGAINCQWRTQVIGTT